LIENIEIIQMAFVEDKLQQKGRWVDINRFEFSCLKTTSIIRIKGYIP
jgi:hypothetical protein